MPKAANLHSIWGLKKAVSQLPHLAELEVSSDGVPTWQCPRLREWYGPLWRNSGITLCSGPRVQWAVQR